ncbi:AlpA Predicted transcriptional regulator [Sphingomonadaceae bacterium]
MDEGFKLLRRPDVSNKVKISKTQIYRLIRKGQFPPPFKLSERVSVWNEGEIDSWLAEKSNGRAA